MEENLLNLVKSHGAGPFPTLDLDAIAGQIMTAPKGEWGKLWHDVALRWAEYTRDVLNRFVDSDVRKQKYRLDESQRLLVISPFYAGAAARWPAFGEWVLKRVLPILGELAELPPWPIPVCFLHNVPTFDMYLSGVAPEDRLMPGGVYVSGGPSLPHVAVLGCGHLLGLRLIVTHELIHAVIHHRKIPLWLEEGICHYLEMDQLRLHNLRDSIQTDFERNAYWQAHGLETFWSGACFGNIGAYEAYFLAMRIVRRLLEEGIERFRKFVRQAQRDDGGDMACRHIYGRGLAAVAAEFLGAGDWKGPSVKGADVAVTAGEVEAREYAVYDALFRTSLFDFENSTVQDETGGGDLTGDLTAEQLSGPLKYRIMQSQGLREDFDGRNRTKKCIAKKFYAPGGWDLLSERRAQADEDVAGQYFVLSRVGFSASGEEALVHIYYYGGPKTAVGHLVLFQRGPAGWVEIVHDYTSIS